MFFRGLKKFKIDFYIYIHIILAKKLLGLVICSGGIESCGGVELHQQKYLQLRI